MLVESPLCIFKPIFISFDGELHGFEVQIAFISLVPKSLLNFKITLCLLGPLGAEIKNLFLHFEAMIVRQNKDVLSHFGEVLKTLKFT